MDLAAPGDADQGGKTPQRSAAFQHIVTQQLLQEAAGTVKLQLYGMSLEEAVRAEYLFLTNSGKDARGDHKTKHTKSTRD